MESWCWVEGVAVALGAPAMPGASLTSSTMANVRGPSPPGDSAFSWHGMITAAGIGHPVCSNPACLHEKQRSFPSCPSENLYIFPFKGNK